jgi:hypothetical protein
MDYKQAICAAKAGHGVKLPEDKEYRFLDETGLWVDKNGKPAPSLTKDDTLRNDWQGKSYG